MDDIDLQLNNLNARLDESIVELDQAASLINAVVLYIYIAAPGHLECSWLSNFYSNIVEEDVCVTFKGGIVYVISGLALLSAAGFLLICIMSDCGNPNRTTLVEDRASEHLLELGSAVPQSRYPNLAFGQRMPNPIAGPSTYNYADTKSDIPLAHAVPIQRGHVTHLTRGIDNMSTGFDTV